MGSRILNWYFNGNPDMPSFYAEHDYMPAHIRLHSKNAPGTTCQVDIRDDGVSILSSYAELSNDQNLEALAGDFPNTPSTIEEGSVITCHIIGGGASTVSIQFEMETIDDTE